MFKTTGLAIALSALTALPAVAQQAAPFEFQDEPSAASDVPSTLTIPAGTVLTVQVRDRISSDRNTSGDSFLAAMQQPLVVDGWVVARPGQTIIGRVMSVEKAGLIRGTSKLALELTEMVLVDGQQMSLRTQLLRDNGPSTRTDDAGVIATGVGLGSVIGSAVDGGRGAAIGAAAGAGAAIAGVLSTRGKATEIYPETILTFRLESPLTVSTVRGRQAFLPVAPVDYDNANSPPVLRAGESRVSGERRTPRPSRVWISPAIVIRPRHTYVVRQPRILFEPRIVVQPRIVFERHGRR